MIKYSTDISSRGEYRLVFETTDRKSFKAMEQLAEQLYNLQPTDFAEPEEVLGETTCMDEGPDQFKTIYYKPTCPHGYTDCIYDPAYIKATYPSWYAKLHGGMTDPEHVSCDKVNYCPDGERYDDEDK